MCHLRKLLSGSVYIEKKAAPVYTYSGVSRYACSLFGDNRSPLFHASVKTDAFFIFFRSGKPRRSKIKRHLPIFFGYSSAHGSETEFAGLLLLDASIFFLFCRIRSRVCRLIIAHVIIFVNTESLILHIFLIYFFEKNGFCSVFISV